MAYPLTEEEFRSIYAKVPRLCVDLVIMRSGGVLLTKRSIDPYRGYWHLPGGTVYFGEDTKDAAKRVAKDELSLDISVGRLLDVLIYPDEVKGNWHGWPIGIAYEVEVVSGEVMGSHQAEEFAYFKTLPEKTVKAQADFLRRLGFSSGS